MFRFGLPVIAGYLALVVWPSVRVLRSPVAREDKLKAIMLVFWFLTMMGLSVFAGIDYTPQSLLIIFLAGRCQTLLGSYPRQAWQPRRAGVARPHAAGRVRGEIRRESGVRI